MMRLPGLTVDIMTENTREAINYFKKNNYRFDCIGESLEEDIFEISRDKQLKFKVYRLPNKGTLQQDDNVLEKFSSYNSQKLRALIKEVEANASLFNQLEHLIRNYPADQVLDCDIKLIVQNLQYWTTGQCTRAIKDDRVVMGNNTNLACLGLVAQILKKHKIAFILSNPATVVVCHLFTELCHKVGLTNVKLLYSNELETDNTYVYPGNCVGVITENADVDSAVDVLMESSSMSQWRLARMLVQENVYNTFKQAVQWKTRENSSHQLSIADNHKSKCTEVYAYKGKVLLMDYAGNSSGNNDDGITVEAYRTTKELLSLVAGGKHYFMSLWSDSLSESNEIAYHDTMPNLVWINAFGVFGGPAESSQPFYEHLNPIDNKVCVNKMAVEKQMKWSRLTFDHRRNLIVSTLKEIDVPKVNEIVEAGLVNWNRRDVIHMDSGKMCVCSTKKHAFTLRTKTDCIQILRDLAIGTAVVVTHRNSPDNDIGSLIEHLINVGAPVMFNDDLEDMDVSVVVDNGGDGYTKVVWSDYGTIFAN